MVKKKLPPRLEQNLAKSILQFISGKRYSPLDLTGLIKGLSIPKSLEKSFQTALDTLVKKNELSLERGRYVPHKNKTSLVVGSISVHATKGFGFVKSKTSPEVFIPKHSVNNAVDGDTVEVEITEVSAKGPEGRVIAILKRSRTHLACTVLEKTAEGFTAFSPLLGAQKTVLIKPSSKLKIQEGDRLICQVLDWNNEEDAAMARPVRRIGHISDPSCDIQAAIEEFELPDGFTKEAIAEAKAFGERVKTTGRLDLSTTHECVTIDPTTAKDYDDAISLTCDQAGHFHLGVHIADVAAYVKEGSFLDEESFLRCNSTYFPGFCLPMLPFELSNELCSLKPNVKRLTASVLAEFDQEGTLVNYRIERTCIKSKKRLTYEEAFAILQKKKKSPLLPLLERMVSLCHLFKRKRFERGSIDFAMTEGVIIVDAAGVPQRIERVEYDITHQMIEEFMLKANELVAMHLTNLDKKLIYRVHDEPSPETFEDFYAYARSLGFFLPPQPKHRDIQKLFEEAKGSSVLKQLTVSFIRSMKIACYSPDNIGHFGLGLEHYCHFTSPIRRYTDLIIQRLLFNEENPKADLTEIAKMCSEKERLSMRAEQSVLLLKKLRLANIAFQADPNRIYPVSVSRVKPFALFFNVAEFDLEGSLHVSELGNDYFEYDAQSLSFKGRRSRQSFSSGSTFYVKIKRIDLVRQAISWETSREKKPSGP